MFISWSTFGALLKLGLVVFTCSGRARGENDLDKVHWKSLALPLRADAVNVGERSVLGQCECGYTKNNASKSRLTGEVQNDYPMIAALAIVRNYTSYWVCQGTIISSRHILTTRKCSRFVKETFAVVGPYATKNQGFGGQFGLPIIEKDVRNLKKGTLIKCEPDPLTMRPDVLTKNKSNIPYIYVLESPIIFSSQVGPACLPLQFSEQDLCSSNVYLIGWEERPEKLSTVKKSELSIVPNIECVEKIGNSSHSLCLFAQDTNLTLTSETSGVYYTGPDGGVYIVGFIDNDSPRNRSLITALNIASLSKWILKKTGLTV